MNRTRLLRPGLVSISFRSIPAIVIAKAAAAAGLEGIEWGGDIHVPHGNLATAREVAGICSDEGLAVAAYGSYLRFGQEDPPVQAVLDTAQELGAPLVRVWAGDTGSLKTGNDRRRVIENGLQELVASAAVRRIQVALEFHGGTLTDSIVSTMDLLDTVPGLLSLWQPAIGSSVHERVTGLKLLLPRLANMHVYNWDHGPENRRPLSEARESWQELFRMVADNVAPKPDQQPELCWALLEFMPDDSLLSLPSESDALLGCIRQAQTGL